MNLKFDAEYNYKLGAVVSTESHQLWQNPFSQDLDSPIEIGASIVYTMCTIPNQLITHVITPNNYTARITLRHTLGGELILADTPGISTKVERLISTRVEMRVMEVSVYIFAVVDSSGAHPPPQLKLRVGEKEYASSEKIVTNFTNEYAYTFKTDLYLQPERKTKLTVSSPDGTPFEFSFFDTPKVFYKGDVNFDPPARNGVKFAPPIRWGHQPIYFGLIGNATLEGGKIDFLIDLELGLSGPTKFELVMENKVVDKGTFKVARLPKKSAYSGNDSASFTINSPIQLYEGVTEVEIRHNGSKSGITIIYMLELDWGSQEVSLAEPWWDPNL